MGSKDTHEHNFRESGSGYASLQATKEFLELNEIGVDISLVNPKHQTLPPSDFQMCCSFLSMGFHYPCNEYEEFILNASPGSMFLFDKRLGAPDPGFENVMKQYKIVGKINNGKASRLGLIKSDGSGEPSNV